MNREHVAPLQLNDTLSSRIFKNFINRLDPQRIYFNATDYKQLANYEFQIDNDIQNESCNFLKLTSNIYNKRLESSKEYLRFISNKTFDYSKHELYQLFKHDDYTFPINEKERKTRIQRRIKVNTLQRMYIESNQDSSSFFADSSLAYTSVAKNKSTKRFLCKIEHILNHNSSYFTHIGNEFLDAIAKSYDPHSAYFDAKEKREYDLHLATENETFGVYFEEDNNEEFVISTLSPGGPAWKSNLLGQDDVLKKLVWENGQEEDLTCATEYSLNKALELPEHNSLTLTVKTTNRKIVEVTLTKENLRVDDNTIKGFILKGEKKIGYLSIPSFYSDDDATSVEGCANDVAKEIIKLNREGIEGLILDLRFNGGGSLKEAIDFSGIFINEGPMCLIKERNQRVQLLKDFNRGRIYNGPLVVMINELSASASEILASNLQDYNRAVIVGSQSFGKATGQFIIPLDTNYTDIDMLLIQGRDQGNKYAGFLKISNIRLYRPSTKSNQINGIEPDITFPSIWKSMTQLEKDRPYALSPSTIDKKVNYIPYPPLNITTLQDKSKTRRMNTKNFTQLETLIDSVNNAKQLAAYPLNMYDFWNTYEVNNAPFEKYVSLTNVPSAQYKVKNNEYDGIIIEMDELIQSINKQLIDDIQNDIFIDETYSIILDLIDGVQ